MNGSRNWKSSEELPCVWSLAGVLGMHPCDRGYDCDSCELFHALSGRGAPGEESPVRAPILSQREREIEADVGRIVSEVMNGCRLDLDRWYGRDGIWLSSGGPGDLDVGLVGCVWRVLQPVREVVPPRSGLSFERGETCGWLVRSDRAIPIRVPVSGTVTDVNEQVVSNVQRSGQVDGPDAWLFRINSSMNPAEVSRLFRGEDTLVWHLRKLRILKGYLREALDTAGEGVGLVMADGGYPETNLESILGTDRFSALVEALFRG
jgi:glycine cleavage system H lipoate-binding protein